MVVLRRITGAALLASAGVALALAAAPRAALAEVARGDVWGRPVDAQLAAVSAVVAWALLGWLVFGAALSALARLPGALGRCVAVVADRVTPVVVRRAVDAALGVAIATAGVGAAGAPAHASPPAARPGVSAGQLGDRVVAPPVAPFDRPAAAPLVHDPRPPERTPPGSPPIGDRVPAAPERDGVVVLRGDSLWSIAAAALPPGADDAAIAAEWRRWYAANRAVIGADPDLIRPGQRLVRPPAR